MEYHKVSRGRSVLNKVISILIIQSFLLSNISFAFTDRITMSAEAGKSTLAPALLSWLSKLDDESLGKIYKAATGADLEGRKASVEGDWLALHLNEWLAKITEDPNGKTIAHDEAALKRVYAMALERAALDLHKDSREPAKKAQAVVEAILKKDGKFDRAFHQAYERLSGALPDPSTPMSVPIDNIGKGEETGKDRRGLSGGLASSGQVFPVKLVDKKMKGVDSSRKAGTQKVLAGARLKAEDTGLKIIGLPETGVNASVSACAAIYREAIGEFLAGAGKSQFDFLLQEFRGGTEIPIQFVRDNDRLVDFTNISGDIANPKMGLRVDVELAQQLGISLNVNGRLACNNSAYLAGAKILSAMAFIHQLYLMNGYSEREANHGVVDYYLSISQSARNAVIQVLRTEKIDSGNIFNIFLAGLTDEGLVKETEDFDIGPYVFTTSAKLKEMQSGIQMQLIGTQLSEAERGELESKSRAIEATMKWRDKQISWLMLFKNIDLPFDYERVANIMKEGYDRQSRGELNVDEWQIQLHEAITGTFNPEIEDRNIFDTAKWLNQRGIRNVVGRLGRAFENQARMVSCALYVVAQKEMRDMALTLRSDSNDMEQLRIPLQKLVLLLTQTTEPSFVELDVTLQKCEDAVLEYQKERKQKLLADKRGYGAELTSVSAKLKWYDRQITDVDVRTEGVLARLSGIRAELDKAKKKDAAFVFLIQRLVPQETHKLAKAVTFRDVDPGKEPDIRDLLRKGGHRAYCTPGQGKDYNVLMFADDIIEAIPMLVKERIIEVTRTDGTTFSITQAEVDQKGMEVFFRNVFAPNFLKNIRNRMDTQVIELARQILFGTEKYKPYYEKYGSLEFAEFMQAMQSVEGFKEDVTGLAAVIDQSYANLLEKVLDFQKSNNCDRVAAIREVVLGKNGDRSGQNLAAVVLSTIGKGIDVSKAVAAGTDTAKRSYPGFENRLNRISPYWDWKARRMPTLHDLTTQAPGLTEAYIETWVEEEMTLINILEDLPEQQAKMKELGADYQKRVLSCTRQILEEYGMTPLVEEVFLNNRCRNEDEAVLQMLMVYPFVADEAAKLLMLSEYGQAGAATLDTFIGEHSQDKDFLKEAVAKTIALNGLTLKNQIGDYQEEHRCDELTAAIAVISADANYDNDFLNNKKFCARSRMLEALNRSRPDDKIDERVKAFIRNYTSLGLSTARKETIALRHLQHLMLDPKYSWSAEGIRKMYNLLYTPSRVNLGFQELWSIMGWSQAIGAKGAEAARAGYDFYRLINRDPTVYASPRIAEALKALENGYKSANYGISNAFAIFISYLGHGDIQRLIYEMNSRGDRMAEYPGEGYGGYCVPKDGLFNVFIIKLGQKQKLADMGVDPRFHDAIVELSKKLLRERVKFDNEFDWEMYAAKEIMRYEKLKEYVRIDDKKPILIFNITNLAKVIEGIGRPHPAIATGERMLLNVLSEWGLEPVIEQNERINRMMPFLKCWMILKNNPKRVNLTAEYKAITGEDRNVADARFATGMRMFEILSGCCDHLIRQMDEEGQNLARLLRFGFDPDSADADLKKAAIWFMEKFDISNDDREMIARLKTEMPYFEPPQDIVMTATSGVAIADMFSYTSDRQVSPEDIAKAAQQFIADLGLSDKQMAAAADVFGAKILDWPRLRDVPELKGHLDKEIDVPGLDGKTYRYKLGNVVHYLALRQRTIARSYQSGLQGCDTVNLGVVSGALEKLARLNMPMFITLMLNDQPDEEPKLIDGSPGRSDPALRAYVDTDIKLFFATCENIGKRGVYEAPGFGQQEGERLRETMHLHRDRSAEVLKALEAVSAADGAKQKETIAEAERALRAIENDIDASGEATRALQDEEMYSSWKKLLPRDRWLSICLSNLAAGIQLSELDFGTWLAMGGMYLLTGKSPKEIDRIKSIFDKAQGIIKEHKTAASELSTSLSLTEDSSEECIGSLLMPEYEPTLGEFTQQKLVEISSKAVEAGATLARERRKALEKRAAVARARRLTISEYKRTLNTIADDAKGHKDEDSHLKASLNTCKEYLSTISDRSIEISKGARTQDNLDALNKAYGGLSAHIKTVFSLLIDRYPGRYASGDEAKDRGIQKQLRMDLDDIFGINGFNVAAIKKFLGGYESVGGLSIIAQAAAKSPEAKEELSLVTETIEYFYSLYAVAQTIEFLQVAKEDVDLRMLWDSVTVFFAETINDHFYEYIPWAYSRGAGYKKLSKEEIYKLAAKHHQWLYGYMRNVMVNSTDISGLPENEQKILLGDISESGVVTDAAGCDYERKPDGSELNEGEAFWRAYNQLREITFIMNDGLAAMDIIKQNPDLVSKGFEPNSKYPMPIVFDNFDPSLIDADNRVNMAFLFPVGRTHQSKLIRSAASASAKRIAAGKPGINAIITRFAPIQEKDGKKFVALKDGQFYMSKNELKNALRVCKGYSEEAADLYIADLEKQGSIVDGRIRAAVRFSRPVISTSVVPFHHLPIFDDGALEDAGIPATCQSLYTEWITYDKSCYAEMLEGTGVELPAEMRWLTKWESQFSSDEEMIRAIIDGSASVGAALTDSNNNPVELKGLRRFAKEFVDQGIEPIVIVKGAAESGARGQKVFMMTTEESLREVAEFVLMVSRAPQNMVIQRVIRINPEFWASEALMNEFVDRRIIERSSPVVRTRYPRTPYYCSFRVVPASSGPDKPYEMTSHIMVMNTEIATNVGRGGSLEPLINQWIHENYQDIIQGILNDSAETFMQAINRSAPQFAGRFEKIFGRSVGKDILGTPYSWMAFGLLDFLAEPVFEREGKIVDIEPVYEKGARIGSRVWLEDSNGERFEGKIKKGKAGWRVYMIEPNTGIGQVDRRTLRMEEIEVERAAKEDKAVDWDAIESEDHKILNSWADRGVEYGKALFGDGFFRPSPTSDTGSAPVTVSVGDYLKASGVSVARSEGGSAGILKKAYETARNALSLGEKDTIDRVSLSVLLKYCFVESLKQRPGFNIDDIRKKVISGEWTMSDLDSFLAPSISASGYVKAIERLLAPMCGKELKMTKGELHDALYTRGYIQKVWGLVRAHLISEWSCPEVEIMADTVKGSEVRAMMPNERRLVAHTHWNNPIAANETFALIADAQETDVGVIGVDASQQIFNGNSSSHILAYVRLPGQDKKRLISFDLTEPVSFDAIWRDETCPAISSSLPQINPKDISDVAHDKFKTLTLLKNNGITTPEFFLVDENGERDLIIKDLREWAEGLMEISGKGFVEIYISPNGATQGIGTKHFIIKKGLPVKEAAAYIKQLNCDVVVRESVGNIVYKAGDSPACTIDMRFNVAYTGKSYEVVSEAMLISGETDAETASVRTGGTFIAPQDAYRGIYRRAARSMKRVVLTSKELADIRAQVAWSLEALNAGRPESERLIFAGIDVKLEVSRGANRKWVIKPVVLEVNSQAAGLSHSYSLTQMKADESDYENTEPQAITTEFLTYLLKRIESQKSQGELSLPDGAESARTAPEGRSSGYSYDPKSPGAGDMNATISAMEFASFDTRSDPGWGIEDIEKQKEFYRLIVGYINSGINMNSRSTVADNYLKWLVESVFVKMQGVRGAKDYANRLWPNELMDFISRDLSASSDDKRRTAQLAVFSSSIEQLLPYILVKIADNNVDSCHRFFTDLATLGCKERAVDTLEKYMEIQCAKPASEKAKAQTACAIAADILRKYLNKEKQAKLCDVLISRINKELYTERKTQLLDGIFGKGSRPAPTLVKNGETREFLGTCPNRKCDSSAAGSDALYALHLDPDGGMAINYPVLFSEERGLAEHMPVAVARRTEGNKIVLRAISNLGVQEAAITADNIEELFSAKDGRVFADKGDQAHFLKYALFFSGIIGSGISNFDDLSEERRLEAQKNPMLCAQIYYDHIKTDRSPDRSVSRQALTDISAFTRGGGIELTCDNHAAPLAAGFSSSSSASIGILRALYAMSGQRELLEPQVSVDMALIFENDLGRGTGDQDTTGTLQGIHNITYTMQKGVMVRKIDNIVIAPSIREELEKRTVVFVPGIPRAASKGIGARQNAYLLREPRSFASIQTAKLQHKQIVEALIRGDLAALGRLEWEYTENRAKIHADALPDEMRALFSWLLGKEDLTIGGKSIAPKFKNPLILGGELAGSMGTGASAPFIASDFGLVIASDFGLERTVGRNTRLDAALAMVIEKAPYFKDAYLRYLKISDKGPGSEIYDSPKTEEPASETQIPSDIRALSSKPIDGVKTMPFPSKNIIVVCRIGEYDPLRYINHTLEELKSHENDIHFVSIKTDLSNLDAAVSEIGHLNPDIVFMPHKDDIRPFVTAARGRIMKQLNEMVDESGKSKTAVFYETAGMVRQYNLIWQINEQEMEKKRQAMLQYPSQMQRLPFNTATEYAMKANIKKARAEISGDINGRYAELYQFMTIKGGEIQASAADKYYFMGESEVRGCERFEEITGSLIINLAPHYDDAEISTGGLCAKLSGTNELVIVDMTTGHRAEIPGVASIEEKVRMREAEAEKASRIIGAAENIFLRLPFYDHTDAETNQRIVSEEEKETVYRLVHDKYAAFKKKNPAGKFVMMMPQEKDAHPDHVATNHIGLDAARRLSREEGAEITVLFYIAPWAGEANAYVYVPNKAVEKMVRSAADSGKEALEAMLYSGKAAAIVATELTAAGGLGAKALTPMEIGGEYAERLNITKISPSSSTEPLEASAQLEELLARITVSDTEAEMGEVAAEAILKDIRDAAQTRGKAVMLFASAPSQHSTWKALIDLWDKLSAEEQKHLADNIIAFHMDEYLGLEPNAEQLFGKVLRERVFAKLGIKAENTYYFNDRLAYGTAVALRKAIDEGNTEEAERLRERLEKEAGEHTDQLTAEFMRHGGVFDIVIGGIGKLPHLAFNDPPEAKFNDPKMIKVVRLTETSRQQQVDDKEFEKLSDVPTHALTFSLKPILSARRIHIIVPRAFKAESVRRTLDLPVSEANPASGLRLPDVLPKVSIYLDKAAASLSSVARMAGEKRSKAKGVTDSDIAAIAEDVRASTTGMSAYISTQSKEANALSGFVVVMKEGLPESIAGSDGVLGSVLQHESTLMQQQISKLFAEGDRGLVRVTNDNFSSEVTKLIAEGRKVIILDDGSLIQNTNLGSIDGAKPGVNCCVITAEKVDPEEGVVPFVNLNAMAMMGVAILSEDAPLFKLAYKTFTGKEYSAEGVINFADKAFWSIVRALPRSLPVFEAIGLEERVRKVFAAAA